jgi:hypothetical protein
MSPVKYELGFSIPEDDILHSHGLEYLESYIVLTGCAVSCEVRAGILYPRTRHSS